MPQLVCPRCQRANPDLAGYCHFDGTPLRLQAGKAGPAPGQLPHEFVFPSGRVCRSYDELAQGCQQEWADARRLLLQGVFSQYLAGAGRMDLAASAQKAQAHADPDMGLHVFISSLPATRTEGPRLDIRPRRLIVGTLMPGETRQVRLTIANAGKGVLNGSLSVTTGGEWLRLVDCPDGSCTLKTSRDQQVNLLVDTRQLAARQNAHGKLTVITNGGIVEVPASVEVGAIPFPRQPFQGSSSPRELAERMRAQPKPAVALLENGEIARWFTANGWVYPVPATTARGVAAVQQFFEGMGLSKPPPLQLSETEAHFLCLPPEVAEGKFTLRTPTRKWVYANVDTDVPWMRVLTPTVSGAQQAVIQYEVDSSLMDPGRIHEGTVQLVANAGQRLAFRVFVDVRRPKEPFTRRLFRPFFAGLLLCLLYRLLLAIPADLIARVLIGPPGAGTFDTWLSSPLSGRADVAVPFVRHFVLATWWLGAVAGAIALWQRGSRWADVVCGLVAGAVAGVLFSATLACLLPALDTPSRWVWQTLAVVMAAISFPRWAILWTPLWILLTALSWALLGGIAAFLLQLIGQRGRRLLAWLGLPVAWLARVCGWEGLANFFAFA